MNMRRFLSFGLPVLASLCVLSSTAQAGPFDFLKRGAAGPRLVAQADPPLPAPGVSRGAGPTIQPVGDEQPPVPIPDERSAPPAAAPIELYPCVTYEDRDEMHPCAVPVVVGVPDPKYGEELCAWIKLKAGQTATIDEIRDFCRRQLAHYKVPRYVKFVDSFPQTVTGKIQKFKIREQMKEELDLVEQKTA